MASKTPTTLPEGTDTVIDTADTPETGTTAEPSAFAKARQRAGDEAKKLTGQATDKAKGYAADGKAKATGGLRDVQRAMDDAAGSVDERLGENYGEYARMASSFVGGVADKLDAKEIDDLIEDAQNFVRKSPVVAIGIAAVAGFAIARLVKSGMGPQDSA